MDHCNKRSCPSQIQEFIVSQMCTSKWLIIIMLHKTLSTTSSSTQYIKDQIGHPSSNIKIASEDM